MLILAVGGGLVVVLLVIGIAVTARGERALVEERLGRYLEDQEELAAQKKSGEKASPIGDWVNGLLEGSKLGGGISRELARADLKIKPGEYLATMVISFMAVGFLVGYISNRENPLNIAAAIGGIVGLFLPRMYVRRQQGKRLARFSDQLADMLNLMVNGLRAGYSNLQALESVSKEMPSPISDEFRRVVQEMQLGLPMEQALDNLLRRIPSDDLDLVITAMNVQREVGGNLAEILDTISYTIRERVRIKGEIRVLTSQVLYSGSFLAMMPVIVSLVLWVVNQQYMREFFNPETRMVGIPLLILGAIMIISGYFAMKKIAAIDV
ncbi:MAG: type II secretion system F family protein [Anaerolineales bacterium]|nr:type II secretion system F family protein [Anaerolineales bacterium]